MERKKDRGTMFRLAILWSAILLLASFWLTVRETSDPVSLAVVPQAPREGEPVMATFKLNNPSSDTVLTAYQFYANGELLQEGATNIAPGSSKSYQYAYENPLLMGEQVNFMVKTRSELGSGEKVVSLPSYPPQVWSSFVSFASFSTSVMSSMSTMTYYEGTFSGDVGLNVGAIAAVMLLISLIFLELTRSAAVGGAVARLGRLRIRFSTVTWILFIIFIGMVYTRVVMILAR